MPPTTASSGSPATPVMGCQNDPGATTPRRGAGIWSRYWYSVVDWQSNDLDRRRKPVDISGSAGQSSSDAWGQTVLAGPSCPCKTGLMTPGKRRNAVSCDANASLTVIVCHEARDWPLGQQPARHDGVKHHRSCQTTFRRPRLSHPSCGDSPRARSRSHGFTQACLECPVELSNWLPASLEQSIWWRYRLEPDKQSRPKRGSFVDQSSAMRTGSGEPKRTNGWKLKI